MNAASQLSITNFSARNACQRSGMVGEIARSHFREKRLTLETLERTALSAATEAEKAINDIAFSEHAIVVSKVTQICADWFIKLASEAVPLGGKWISPAYDGTKNVVAILNGTFTPLKLLKETSKTLVKGVTEFAKESQHESCARLLKVAGTLTKAAADIHELHRFYSESRRRWSAWRSRECDQASCLHARSDRNAKQSSRMPSALHGHRYALTHQFVMRGKCPETLRPRNSSACGISSQIPQCFFEGPP